MKPTGDLWRRAIATVLCVTTLIVLAGCGRRPRPGDENDEQANLTQTTPDNDGSSTGEDSGNADTTVPLLNADNLGETVDPSDIVDTFNVALVLDTSASMEASDSYGLALGASVMFLESMYAGSADEDRLGGAKHANVNIITYNNTVTPLFGQLYSMMPGQ